MTAIRSTPFREGADFGPFRLIRLLGQGGFAQVWEAESRETGRHVALKVLTEIRAESSRALERFQQEGRLAASITHPRCVYVFGTQEIEGYPAITMELMPGGTLADRLKQGPLPAAEAVDDILDVLDGLEAAQRKGIIHRDVKPSNCFLDESGGAKIGDFGISKSLESDSALTATGSFLGTPYYAAPEQVSGEPLDLRADLYSVGAMLYELLTGATPFTATNAGQLVAQVLTKEPTSFSTHSVEVPRGLQRVVLRLLAKNKEKRYPSYQALRVALLPFSSRALDAAALVKRFGAYVFDMLLFFPFGLFAGFSALGSSNRGSTIMMGLGMVTAQIVYFGLMEGLLGWSLGKRLLGLRVLAAGGGPAQLHQTFVRAVVFLGIYSLSGLFQQISLAAGGNLGGAKVQVSGSLLFFVSIAILVSTMRRRNGFAGLHELVSRTRVVALEQAESRIDVSDVAIPLTSAPTASYGPYTAVGTMWRSDDEALVVAHDNELHRDVWVHLFRDPRRAPPIERLHGRRAGSLPWLQRAQADGWWWDAYGAPSGVPLVGWVHERGRLAWPEVREALHSVVVELVARFEREATAGTLSLQHVWVDRAGHAVLLDMPAESPGASSADTSEQEVTPDNWVPFVRDVLALSLTGHVEAAEAMPGVPLPEYARSLVQRVVTETPPFESPGALANVLEGMRGRLGTVTQLRRLAPFGVAAMLPALIVGATLVFPVFLARMPSWYLDLGPRLPTYERELRRLDADSATADSASRATARAIRIVLSHAYAASQGNPQMRDAFLSGLPTEARAVVQHAAEQYPSPSDEDVEAARVRVRTHAAGSGSPGMLLSADSVSSALGAKWPKALGGSFQALGFFGFVAVVLALIFRGPVLLQVFGIAVQSTAGEPAGRWRCAARSLVAWAPLMALLLLGDDVTFWVSFGLIAVGLAGAYLTIQDPARGPADRLMGTVLVPK